MEPERIECTRAEFAAQWGIWPHPDTIGTCIISRDGTTIVQEYVFTDEPYLAPTFLKRKDLLDIAELERMHKL